MRVVMMVYENWSMIWIIKSLEGGHYSFSSTVELDTEPVYQVMVFCLQKLGREFNKCIYRKLRQSFLI